MLQCGQPIAHKEILMSQIKLIQHNHILDAKKIADANRDALSFVTRGKFQEAVEQKRGLVALQDDKVIGFVLYRHRKRDKQTTLSDICVDKGHRGEKIGRLLVEALVQDCRKKSREFIQLKCPTDLPANEFYHSVGFKFHDIENGKKRKLNVWRLTITPTK
jgi:ribosomal protein S18 acetylase RimI-like enzyme